MITLHRRGRQATPFQIDPGLIATIEAAPAHTVVTFVGRHPVVVIESPAEIVELVREHHARRAAATEPALAHPLFDETRLALKRGAHRPMTRGTAGGARVALPAVAAGP